MSRRPHDRQAARARGMDAERLAEWLLRLKLFRIIDRNYRIRDGELDIVARRGRLVVFVEVKARTSIYEGMESVSGRKQQRISRAARQWLSAHPWAMTCSLRADGIFLAPGRLPHHVPSLFTLTLD